MPIKDRVIREAVENIAHEFECLEDLANDLSNRNDALEQRCDELELENEQLKFKVKELEEALAEAHLTGDADE